MNTAPLSEPWETLGETGETALENFSLEDDSPDPWEIAGETQIKADFFDPDLLEVYRQLRFGSPESLESPESSEVVSEADESLENSTEQVTGEVTTSAFSPTISPVHENNKQEKSPTFGNDTFGNGRAGKSQHFQEIDRVNLITHRQPDTSPFLSRKKTVLSPPRLPQNTIFSFVSHPEKSSSPPSKILGIRQGDVLIMPLTEAIAHWVDHDITLPFWRDPGFQKCPDLVLATGQSTGHQHRISQGKADLYQRRGIHYLRVLSPQAVLSHPEHQAVAIPQGIWVVRRQREYHSLLQREQFVSD